MLSPNQIFLNSKLVTVVKVFSTILISGALGLEAWNLFVEPVQARPLQGLVIALYVGRVALVSHGIEAVMAAMFASSKQRSPLSYSVYTFFVGTVGLVELFRQPDVKA